MIETRYYDDIFRGPLTAKELSELHPISGTRDTRIIEGAGVGDRFASVVVSGDSMAESRIFDGDLLVFRYTTKYIDGAIGVWDTPDGRAARYAEIYSDGTLDLHNNADWTQEWRADEVKLLGLVVRVERDLEVGNA